MELLQFLHDRAHALGPNHRLTLNLSNIQGIDMHTFAQALPVHNARNLFDAFHKNPDTCMGALRMLNGGSLTTWAPSERGTLLQLATTFQKIAADGKNNAELHLVVPHDPYPTCTTAANVLDL